MSASSQYAYVMKSMTKSFPGAAKPVLNQINLQFYRGAKIGIVGPNGAGKSTLIKIMAGIDTDFTGEAWPGENITVGYLEQEPELDESKTVLENVKDGAREIADMVERFNAIGMEMGEEDADFDALSTEMAELQDKIDAQLRMAAPQKMQARHDMHAREARARCHPQNAGNMAIAAAHPLDRFVGRLHRGARLAQELDALVSEGE